MKKAELIALGVKEENLREFNNRYWEDVRSYAKRLADKGNIKPVESAGKGAGAFPASDKQTATKAAIVAMLPLFDDPARLHFILETVSREYHYQEKERARKEYEAQVEELKQKMHQAKKAKQEKEKPMLEEETAGECPEAAPGVG